MRAVRRRGGGRGHRHRPARRDARPRGASACCTARKSYVLTRRRRPDPARRTRSPPASTIPASAPSTRACKDTGRARYVSVTDDEALDGLAAAGAHRGHPVRARDRARDRLRCATLAPQLGAGKPIVVGLSGRGDKDMVTVAARAGSEAAMNRIVARIRALRASSARRSSPTSPPAIRRSTRRRRWSSRPRAPAPTSSSSACR